MRSKFYQCSSCGKLDKHPDVCPVCDTERRKKADRGVGVVHNLIKAQKMGAVSTYSEGQHSDFYVNELMMTTAKEMI